MPDKIDSSFCTSHSPDDAALCQRCVHSRSSQPRTNKHVVFKSKFSLKGELLGLCLSPTIKNISKVTTHSTLEDVEGGSFSRHLNRTQNVSIARSILVYAVNKRKDFEREDEGLIADQLHTASL